MKDSSYLALFVHHDVEPVDLLSTDEASESIGIDMPDHDRRTSHAYFSLSFR
jgi:hypothetical protein